MLFPILQTQTISRQILRTMLTMNKRKIKLSFSIEFINSSKSEAVELGIIWLKVMSRFFIQLTPKAPGVPPWAQGG